MFFVAHEVGHYDDVAMHALLPIGIALFVIPIGCWISKTIEKDFFSALIQSQLLMSIVGAISFPALGLLWPLVGTAYYALVFFTAAMMGIFLGAVISLSNKILRDSGNWKHETFLQILCTIGCFVTALAVAFLFAFSQASIGISVILLTDFPILAAGIVNFLVFRDRILADKRTNVKILLCSAIVLLACSLAFSQKILHCLEHKMYHNRVIFSSHTSSGQHVVLTKYDSDIRMFIDGHVLFSSVDEHRYHELLVHIPMSLAKSRKNILILGGGDGLAAKEILKYNDVKTITIVDIDPQITDLFKNEDLLKSVNNDSLSNLKVSIVNEDAFEFVKNTSSLYDVVIIDLTDPNDTFIAKLYSKEFYEMLAQKLSANAVVVTQATSPFFSCDAFWCINETFRSAGYSFTKMYHGYIPSFGDWGFVMASINNEFDVSKTHIGVPTKYLNDEVAQRSFLLEKDIIRNNIVPSSLDDPKIISYYADGWKYWN
jgi:spermidine synthase